MNHLQKTNIQAEIEDKLDGLEKTLKDLKDLEYYSSYVLSNSKLDDAFVWTIENEIREEIKRVKQEFENLKQTTL